MKAELSKEGILSITSETELESYALGKWVSENIEKISDSNLLLNWSLDKTEENLEHD